VRVPADAGVGTAKVTFSFDAWKDHEVIASTIELPLKKPKQAEKGPEAKK
jgi:hypothetical protein